MESTESTVLGQALSTNKAAQVGEIAAVFAVPIATIAIAGPWAGEDPMKLMGVVWVANVVMIAMVWYGLRLRGQTLSHFGLRFSRPSRSAVVRTTWQSIVILLAALITMTLGQYLGAFITGVEEPPDLSQYNPIQGNLPLLLISLLGVYIVSSFGEEFVYRAFLMNRIAELGGGVKSAWAAALLGSSVLFGLAHFSWGLPGVIWTTFMGLAFGVAYLLTRRNLWPLILAHVFADTILLVPLYGAPIEGAAGM